MAEPQSRPPRARTPLEPFTLSPEQATEAERQIVQADAELANEDVRVNFRWERRPLSIVKRAAALHGVPYQTYLKQTVVRQALTDLKDAATTR